MDELWKLVMNEASDIPRGFGGKPEMMTKLREKILQPQFASALSQDHISWAVDALNQTLNPTASFNPPIPAEWTGQRASSSRLNSVG
jgi:hypothetical protein